MRFSKVCGVLAALLCAHLVVASTSELPGDPLPNAATPTRLLQVAEGVHKSKEDWRNSIMSDHHGVAAKPVKPQQTSLRKLSIVEHASKKQKVAAAAGAKQKAAGHHKSTSQSGPTQSLAAAYSKNPSATNLKKLNKATDAQLAAEKAAAGKMKAAAAKKQLKKAKKEDKVTKKAARKDARKVERMKAKMTELKSVMKDLTDPAQKAKFQGKVQSAKTELEEREQKLDDAKADKKIADIKAKAALSQAETAKKAAAVLLSVPKAKGLEKAAEQQLAVARKQQTDARKNADQAKVNKKVDGVKTAEQGEKLLKKLLVQSKKSKAEMKTGKLSPGKQAMAAQVMASVKRVKEKLELFKTKDATASAARKTEQVERKLEKQANTKSKSKKDEKKLLKAKKNEKKVEKKLVKEQKKLKKTEQRKAMQQKAAAEQKLDGAIKAEVSAERDALKKAKASGNVKQEMKMLKRIEKADIKQKRKEDKKENKKQEGTVQAAKKDLQQAKKEYAKEKALADEKIAAESKGSLAGADKIEAEVSKLETAATKLDDDDLLSNMTTVSYAYDHMKGASKAIESGFTAMVNTAKREVVGMTNASKQAAQHVINSLAGNRSDSGLMSMTRLASMTELGESSAKKNLTQSKKSYKDALSKLHTARRERESTNRAQKVALRADVVRDTRKKLAAATKTEAATSTSTDQVKVALKLLQARQPANDSLETVVAKKTSQLVKNVIGDVKAGKFSDAQASVKQLKKAKATELTKPAHSDAFMHLESQVHELGELEQQADSVANLIVQRNYKKLSKAKEQPVKANLDHSKTSRSHPENVQVVSDFVEAGAQKAVKEAVSINKKEVAKEKEELAKQTKKLDNEKEKLIPTEAKVAANREVSVVALETQLAGQKKQTKTAKKAFGSANELVKRYKLVIGALSQESKMNTEQQSSSLQVQEADEMDAARKKMRESLLGKSASNTLAKLQSAEKEATQELLNSKSTKLIGNHSVDETVKTIDNVKAYKAQLAEQLLDLREAAGNKTEAMDKADQAKVATLKSEFSSPKDQLRAAERSLTKAKLSRNTAETEYRGSISTVKATKEEVKEVKADKVVEMVDSAKQGKQTAAVQQARNKATSVEQVATLDTTRLKEKEAAAATVLALKLEQDKADQFAAKATRSSEKAEALKEKADSFEQQATKMAANIKKKIKEKDTVAKEEEKQVVKRSQAKIGKAKGRAKAAQQVVEGMEQEKTELNTQNATAGIMAKKLQGMKKMEEASAHTKQEANIAKADADKAFHDTMLAYALHNLKPETKAEHAKLRKKLKKVSPSHAEKFASKYGPESLRVQVAAARKNVADMKYKKNKALDQSAIQKVQSVQKKLNNSTKTIAKAEIKNAKAETKELRKAKKLQRKEVKTEKKNYKKISRAEKKNEKVQTETDTSASLVHIQRQAQIARDAADKAQKSAKMQEQAATTALGALHDTLKQSLQQERQVAKSSEQALTKQIKQVKKGKQPSAVEDDTLATLAKIRGTAQRQAKKFRSSLSAQQKLEDGKLQKSERKVNRVVSNALKSKNTNRV